MSELIEQIANIIVQDARGDLTDALILVNALTGDLLDRVKEKIDEQRA